MSTYVSHVSVNDYSVRVVSRVNYFQKTGGRPNRDIKFLKL